MTDQSSEDLKYMTRLAVKYNNCREDMERLFRDSPYMRDKFNREDYRTSLIDAAISAAGELPAGQLPKETMT